MAELSLIISCYDRATELNRSIGTWFSKPILPDEVLIIDDDSHDGDALLGHVDMFCQQHPEWASRFRLVRRRKPQGKMWRNPCIPHNWAVRNCIGDMFVIIDPEVLFVSDCIGHTKRLLEARKNAFYSAGIHYETNFLRHGEIPSWDVQIIIRHPKMWGGLPQNNSDWVVTKLTGSFSHAYLSGWKQNFLAMGGKDERFTGWGWEDSDLSARMSRCGYTHQTDDSIAIIHVAHNPTDWSQPWGFPIGNAEKLADYQKNRNLLDANNRANLRLANANQPWGQMEITMDRGWE